MEEVIDERHEGNAEDWQISIVFLFEISQHCFVFDADGSDLFALAHDFFKFVDLKFFLIHQSL